MIEQSKAIALVVISFLLSFWFIAQSLKLIYLADRRLVVGKLAKVSEL